MMEVEFFKKFKAWRVFFYWYKHIRQTKSSAFAKTLDGELYILNANLRAPLIQARSVV
jgi:hypothetical protein